MMAQILNWSPKKQTENLDELCQLKQCLKRNQGMISLVKLTAKNRIEHPSGNRDLESFGKFDYKVLFVEPAQGAHHFDLRSIKGMMSVMDLLGREFVSSMMIPCAIPSRLTYSKTGMTFAPSKNSWDTGT